MTRRTPLKRKARIRQKRARPRRSGRVKDRDYMAKVRALPCCLEVKIRIIANGGSWEEDRRAHFLGRFLTSKFSECDGPIEADHAGRRPLGRKCDDSECIPLCRKHHRERTEQTGFFRLFWNAEARRAWCDRTIAETRAALGWSGEAA